MNGLVPLPRNSASARPAKRSKLGPNDAAPQIGATAIHPVDAHVGATLRRLRKAKDLYLSDLAARLNVSLQQVQKYESGEVRMSASALATAAAALEVAVDAFFDDLPDPTASPDALARRTHVGRLMADPDADAIVMTLARLPLSQQRGVLALLRSLTPEADDGRPAGHPMSPPPGKE